MRIRIFSLFAICTLGICACNRREGDAAERKVGKAAHTIAIESGKVIKKAAGELDHATREAHQGWKEAEQERKAKPRE
jgi:hypothetical protein